MAKPTILVTGATGKTGQPVVEQLIRRGFPVRALVRTRDERSSELERLGAKVTQGDFHDSASMREALKEVKRVYFCYPPQSALLVEATAIMASAARDEGVEGLVNMSQISAREESSSPLARQHWLSEEILDWAKVGVVHIRPTFFAEMLYILGADSIAKEGKLYLPYGDERHAPIAADDIARVIVEILAEPSSHAGERYILTGTRNMTISEMAAVLTRELGRRVEYVDLPIEQWGGVLTDSVGLPEFLVTHLKSVAQDHKDGLFSAVTDVVRRISGSDPQSLEEFVRSNVERFVSAGEPARV